MVCDVVGLPARPNLDFHLVCPCLPCASLKKRCDRSFPCFHCKGKRECDFGKEEMIWRAKTVFKMLCEFKFTHSDIARYSINLQCLKQEIKRVLKNSDAKDIYSRLVQGGSLTGLQEPFQLDLPDEMVKMMVENTVYKIEWMRDGFYVANTSPSYSENIIDKEAILQIASRGDVPCKLVDTMNCGDIEVAYKMWMESIDKPMEAIKFTGPVYWKGCSTVCNTSITVMSRVINPTCIATMTVLNKGIVYTF